GMMRDDHFVICRERVVERQVVERAGLVVQDQHRTPPATALHMELCPAGFHGGARPVDRHTRFPPLIARIVATGPRRVKLAVPQGSISPRFYASPPNASRRRADAARPKVSASSMPCNMMRALSRDWVSTRRRRSRLPIRCVWHTAA